MIDVAGSATGSVVRVAGTPPGCTAAYSVAVTRPGRSARGAKPRLAASSLSSGAAVPPGPPPVTRPVGGVFVAVQLTENVVGPVPPAATVTVRGLEPLTVQLLG